MIRPSSVFISYQKTNYSVELGAIDFKYSRFNLAINLTLIPFGQAASHS